MTEHSVIVEEINIQLGKDLESLRELMIAKFPNIPREEIESLIDYALEQASDWEWD